jgi:uncharacterized protein (TIGR03643 family)
MPVLGVRSQTAGASSGECAMTSANLNLTEAETSRLIEMAWEDRVTFEAIQEQFGLRPGQVIALMRRELKASSFRMWRARTAGRLTKHGTKRSGQEIGSESTVAKASETSGEAPA